MDDQNEELSLKSWDIFASELSEDRIALHSQDSMMRLIVDTVILQYSTAQQTGTLRTATTCNGNRLSLGFGRNVQYSTFSSFYIRERILTE